VTGNDYLPYLVTCVGVDAGLEYLPHFLAHYRGLHVPAERFLVILNSADADSTNLARARELLGDYGVTPIREWIGAYTSGEMWALRRAVQADHVPAHAWLLSADVDEFHEYPTDLATLLAECERRGVNCVQGVFIDRVAPQGQLKAIRDEEPIAETFPWQADAQCAIAQTGAHHGWAGTVKVMALRGDLEPSRGGHHPREGGARIHYLLGRHLADFPGIGHPDFRFAVPVRVHHYKWTAGMPKALRERLETPGVSAAGLEYGRKLLAHIDHHDGLDPRTIAYREQPLPANWRAAVRRLRRRAFARRVKNAPRKLAARILTKRL